MRSVVFKLLMASSVIIGGLFPALADEVSAFEEEQGWKFSADIYGWGPQINMETSAGDKMELPLWQILQNLNFTVMAGVSAQKGNWSGFSDFLYMNLQGKRTSTANIIGRPAETGVGIKMQAFINTSAAGYSFVKNANTEVKAFAGARYLWLESDMSFNIGAAGGNVVGQGHVLDGIVGVRGKTEFGDKYFATYYADIGTGQSDLTWQAMVGLGYQFEKFDAVLGWRYLDWNFANKAKLDDLTINGPFAGIKMSF